MSEENTVQSAPKEEQPQKAQEVATDSQDQPAPSDVGALIAESKKYRLRSQKAESELAKLQKEAEQGRQKQLEEQEQWIGVPQLRHLLLQLLQEMDILLIQQVEK